MVEIAYEREKEIFKTMTQEVQEIIEEILQILDDEYGCSKNKYKDDGGYIIVIEKEEDFQELKRKTHIDGDNAIAEYVDKIVCSNGEIYTNFLILCNITNNSIRFNPTEFKRLHG